MDRQLQSLLARSPRVRRTQVLMKVDHQGASATHSGSWIKCGYRWLGRTDSAMRHDFVHERVHNYDFTHGGLMELVVERVRSPGENILTGQLSKWSLLRRLNGLKAVAPTYRDTGLYLLLWELYGDQFMTELLQFDEPIRTQLLAEGFSEGEATAGLLGAILSPRSIERVAIRTGLVEDAKTFNLVVIAATNAKKQH